MKSRRKIFISYERQDIGFAKRIYNDLMSYGLSPWLDMYDLIPGQVWQREIMKAIKNSEFFLALLSNNSISKKGYIQKELKIALELLSEFPEDDIFIIPVRLEECNPGDRTLSNIHWVDLFPENQYQNGLKKILHVVDPESFEKKEVPDELPYMKYDSSEEKISLEKLNSILENHKVWLKSEKQNGKQAILEKTNLRKFDLSSSNLQDANLEEVNLQEAKLVNANLKGINLQGAHLYRANLQKANLQNANLREAYLHDVNLYEADLQNANLTGAMLNEAMLQGTKLLNTNFKNVVLKGIKIDISTLFQIPQELREIYGASFFVQGWTEFDNNKYIIRTIVFPPEYQQAGMAILNYFNTVINQKYANKKISVTIKQEDLKVTMIIETPEGKKEEIEKALHEYSLVIMGKMNPNEYFDNRYQIMSLENQLSIAKVQIENQQRMLDFAKYELKDTQKHLNSLFDIVKKGIQYPEKIDINVSSIIDQSKEIDVLNNKDTDIVFGEKMSKNIKIGDKINIESKGDVAFAKDKATSNIIKFNNKTAENLYKNIESAISKSGANNSDKEDANEQLQKIGIELQSSKPNRKRLDRCWDYITKIIPGLAKMVPWKVLIEKVLSSS